MVKKFKVVILGAGASGCMCALSTKHQSVALIDRNDYPAWKLSMTGNGKCNLTNLNMSSEFYNTNIDKFLERFSLSDTIHFFQNLGLVMHADDEGRVYPFSNTAKSVIDVIDRALQGKVKLYMGQEINDIDYANGKYIITTDKDAFECEKLVISTGGFSSIPEMCKLGVKFRNFVSSLCALRCQKIVDLNGVRISNVEVTATNSKGQTYTEIGEVLFRKEGISGIVTFNMSTLFARNDEHCGKIQIDLLPNMSLKELIEVLEERKKINVVASKFLVGFFHNSIANEIFKQAKINTNVNSTNLTSQQIEIVAKTIKNLQYDIDGFLDYAQVHSGGVSLEDLNDNLMHKDLKNLYFTGEICDVDGICGGYNLQWAWTSGHIVGEDL